MERRPKASSCQDGEILQAHTYRPAAGPAPGIAGAVPAAGWADSGELPPLPCLNSNISTGDPAEPLPQLSPYHQKAAFVLGENVRRFCSLYGLENCGFLTLTFPDNVQDHKEASRRFNSMNTHFLSAFYGQWIWARERQKRGAWHYHLVIECKGDIRTGFDWDEFTDWNSDRVQGKRRRLRTGNPFLRSLWDLNNRAFPSYGFGRVELLPIRSTSEAVASYVGKYISKQVGQRPEEDKGVRLMSHSKDFVSGSPKMSWYTDGGRHWRRNLALFAIHGCCCSSYEEFLEKAPRRWAYKYREDIMSYHLHYNEKYPDEAPF